MTICHCWEDPTGLDVLTLNGEEYEGRVYPLAGEAELLRLGKAPVYALLDRLTEHPEEVMGLDAQTVLAAVDWRRSIWERFAC